MKNQNKTKMFQTKKSLKLKMCGWSLNSKIVVIMNDAVVVLAAGAVY